MTNLTLNFGLDMHFFAAPGTFFQDDLAHGTATTSTDTSWIVTSPGGEYRLTGTGLGSPSSNMPTAGTVTAWDFYSDAGSGPMVLWSFSNMTANASTFSSGLLNGNDTAAALFTNYILGGADVIHGPGEESSYLMGFAGSDQLYGGAMGDVLDGGAGDDEMYGGTGDDIYYVDSNALAEQVIENTGEGTDSITLNPGFNGSYYIIPSNVERLVNATGEGLELDGNGEDNVIVGADGWDDVLDGQQGDDTLMGGLGGGDNMYGRTGNDIYVVDDVTDMVHDDPMDAGVDEVRTTVSYGLATASGVENLTATGSGSLTLTGSDLNNVITGGAGNDTLTGEAGNDTLNGGAGTDVMVGGTGNDTYVVNVAGDIVAEFAAGGNDTVKSSISYTLGANLEKLTLTGSGAINGTGNSAVNTLTGNGGANILDGAAGADVMKGGAGNDTYLVDNAGDAVTEGSGAGTDLVQSSVNYTLANNVEQLTLSGSANTNGTGNSLVNIITGNGGNNVLNGLAGADTMRGGDGNDTYYVDNVGDHAVESSASGGTDTVRSTVTFSLGSQVENLLLQGSNSIGGTGNGLGNAITGNGGANALNGGDGADNLSGGGGNDTISGGYNSDTLTGGAGLDKFLFDSPLNGTPNVDSITDFSVPDDTMQLDETIFAAITKLGTLSASAFFAGTAAHDASDRIVYDSASGNIYYDSDGDGAAAQILFAHVTAGTALTNSDFVIVV